METLEELHEFKKDLAVVEQRIDELEDKIDIISRNVDKMMVALLGNEMNGNRGIIYNVDETKKKVDFHENSLKRLGLVIGSAATIGSVIGFLVKLFLDYFVPQKR